MSNWNFDDVFNVIYTLGEIRDSLEVIKDLLYDIRFAVDDTPIYTDATIPKKKKIAEEVNSEDAKKKIEGSTGIYEELFLFHNTKYIARWNQHSSTGEILFYESGKNIGSIMTKRLVRDVLQFLGADSAAANNYTAIKTLIEVLREKKKTVPTF